MTLQQDFCVQLTMTGTNQHILLSSNKACQLANLHVVPDQASEITFPTFSLPQTPGLHFFIHPENMMQVTQ